MKLNLIGKKFGQLIVLAEGPIKIYKGPKQRHRTWVCSCICGGATTVPTGHLTSGHTTSCGCRQGRFIHGLARTKTIGSTREYKMWNGARGHAKKLKLECSITPADIHIPEKCPLLGILLDKKAPLRADSVPSLDRIDNSIGYIPENIWVISWKANRIKHACTVAELKMIAENLEQAILERKISAR